MVQTYQLLVGGLRQFEAKMPPGPTVAQPGTGVRLRRARGGDGGGGGDGGSRQKPERQTPTEAGLQQTFFSCQNCSTDTTPRKDQSGPRIKSNNGWHWIGQHDTLQPRKPHENRAGEQPGCPRLFEVSLRRISFSGPKCLRLHSTAVPANVKIAACASVTKQMLSGCGWISATRQLAQARTAFLHADSTSSPGDKPTRNPPPARPPVPKSQSAASWPVPCPLAPIIPLQDRKDHRKTEKTSSPRRSNHTWSPSDPDRRRLNGQ
jgi:hypothetical protein